MNLVPKVVQIRREESLCEGKVLFILTVKWLIWEWTQYVRWSQDEMEILDPPRKY